MDLRIEDLELVNFRNYDRLNLQEIGDLTVLVGENGVGKTNILEGIQLLTSASSFRHPKISQLIREGETNARLSASLGDGSRSLLTKLVLEEKKRSYTVNGKAKAISEVRGTLPAVVFTPDDLEIAKKSSSVKRQALDDLGMQLAKSYDVVCRDYEKTLRYKNRLLKEEASAGLVEAINETLVTCGSQLHCFRVALFNKIVAFAASHYDEISETRGQFSATYVPSWHYLADRECVTSPENGDFEPVSRDEVRELMVSNLRLYAEEERSRKRGLIGPHNDKITFFLAGRDVSSYASQGQQRSIVLSWKLAEVDMVKNSKGIKPILLLDDVMSELDERRRKMLVNSVKTEIQTFITSTDLSPFNSDLLERARVVEIGGASR